MFLFSVSFSVKYLIGFQWLLSHAYQELLQNEDQEYHSNSRYDGISVEKEVSLDSAGSDCTTVRSVEIYGDEKSVFGNKLDSPLVDIDLTLSQDQE